MTASNAGQLGHRRRRPTLSLAEFSESEGILAPATVTDLAQDGIFDSDHELDEFLAFVAEQRQEHLTGT